MPELEVRNWRGGGGRGLRRDGEREGKRYLSSEMFVRMVKKCEIGQRRKVEIIVLTHKIG